MEIIFKTKTVPCCREVFRQTKLVQEHAECVVPDTNDDVGKIVWTEAQVCLKSKEKSLRGANVGAEAEICVFYLSEARDAVLSMRFTKELAIEFECVEADEMQISLSCLSAQTRALNSRKIAVDLTIRAELACFCGGSMTVCVTEDDESASELQLLREKRSCVSSSHVCEKSFVVSEQLPVPLEQADRLVLAHAALVSGDCQMIGGKALVKGGAELRFALESTEGRSPLFWEHCVPFSVLIDSGDEECELSSLILQTTALYADLSEAINGGHVIDLELHAAAQACFEKEYALDYIVDAYSTRFPLRCEENSVELCVGREREELFGDASDSISLDADGTVVLAQHAELLSFALREDRAAASAAVSLLLQNADGGFDAVQKLLVVETPLTSPDCNLNAARIGTLSVQTEGGKIAIALSVCFDFLRTERAELHCLYAVEIDEDNAYDKDTLPSLTLVERGGRSLWELAKRYHSSTKAIERINAQYPMQGELLLIPRI